MIRQRGLFGRREHAPERLMVVLIFIYTIE
jgi:hypothetical protein